ncbi:hypothetical protein ISF_02921 [Cordyceps fumosorosea ARSEF 2679]|uniref:Phosphotransferase enzyme family protein n=1 Tax=Cordyceps fumosorosea (strain ARSEF 2679) TaxID=1081104 RepID=A0A168B5M8_CORFA|nr:hypothetical protein ISF_02921 [Cordyceps fumosorosea ARSEF 2679]OAA69651.1 hypothetical protein ISF_02921 [Cordyceps fumosorosea ARSEF 2679]
MSMDNGREVIAKVPNPNAGIPHFTTASLIPEARDFLDTPAPPVHAWNSRAESHPVGAEFIIMDKVEGVPLSLQYKLFNHNPDPAFLDWDGLEPETVDLAPRPKLTGLSPEERSAAVHEYAIQNVFIGWRKLMRAKNPDLYKVVEFRRTAAYGLLFLAHRMFEYGEAHFQSLLVDLKDTWTDLPAVTSDTPFPFDFSEADIERIKMDSDGAVAGTELAAEIKGKMGDLWPDKGFIEHERYDDCKAALDEVKALILEQLAETNKERAKYERYWPFE